MKKKILVISFDAMVGEDIAYLRSKPDSNFNRIMKDCAWVESMRSIYPSITYPAHFSMASGCSPGKTGFYKNVYLPFDPQGRRGWILDSLEQPVEDFFAAAKRAGMTTASVYWPSMANNPNIDWLINECFPGGDEDIPKVFKDQGANEEALSAVEHAMKYFPYGYKGRKLPTRDTTFDDFLMDCLCTLIRERKPDFAVVHHCYIDTMRHRYGLFNEYVQEAVDIADECLGKIAQALKDAKVYEDTNIVIVSDHGQMNISRNIKVNLLLKRAGFLEVNEKQELRSWQAYAQSCGGSAHIYLKDKEDRELYNAVYNYLKGLAADGVWGFREVLTEQETRERYGLWGDFSFVLESDGYTSFGESLQEPLVGEMDLTDYRLGRATHGYAPDKGPQPVFCAKGPGFFEGAYLEQGSILDIAPTLAAIMGQSMPSAEGRVLTELLK